MKKAPFLLFLLIFPLLAQIYEFLNNKEGNAVDLSTKFDQNIPFLSIFIIPYIVWYGYIFCYLIYFCFKDTKVYLKTLLMIVIGEIICFFIYFNFQTTVQRPFVAGDNAIIHIVQWIYKNDEPVNCFPSIHVLTTFTIMLASLHLRKKHFMNSICIHLIGTLIIISTLFVKQHVILDLVGSVFLVTFLYGVTFEFLSFRLLEKSEAIFVKNKT